MTAKKCIFGGSRKILRARTFSSRGPVNYVPSSPYLMTVPQRVTFSYPREFGGGVLGMLKNIWYCSKTFENNIKVCNIANSELLYVNEKEYESVVCDIIVRNEQTAQLLTIPPALLLLHFNIRHFPFNPNSPIHTAFL